MLLASVGIYRMLAYSVAARTREIGIRMAIGATARQIAGMMLRESLMLSVSAVALGVMIALIVTRFLRSMLFGVAPSDAAVLWTAPVLLLVVAAGASWLPARRAARVQPMEALRLE